MTRDSGTLSILSELPINSGFTISLRPSKRLIMIYSVFVILLSIAVGIAHINLGLKLILFSGAAVYIVFLFKKHLFMSHPDAIIRITLTDFNWCFVCYKNNKVIKADIMPDSILTEHLVILNLRPLRENTGFQAIRQQLSGRESVLLTRGRTGTTVFRDLKRRLRLLNFNKTIADK